MVPRTANGRGLNEALEQAGISPVRLADDRVEIAGVPFAVNELKAVRESDARLLAHQHEGDGGAATIIVADGFSCREQINQLSNRVSVHFAELLVNSRNSRDKTPHK